MSTAETPPSRDSAARVTGRPHGATEVSHRGEAAPVLPAAATALPDARAANPGERRIRAAETATFLRTRRTRRNTARGLGDIAAGRTGTPDSLAAALTCHTS